MNPRLRSILIGIGLLTLVIVGIVLIPRGLSIYYQSRGGQHIDYVMRSVEGIQELVCEPLPESNQAAIEEVERGVEDLHLAVHFNKRSAHSYYQLGKAYCLLGEPDDAMKSYQQYTGLRPDNPLGHIGLGFAYEVLGEVEKTKDAWIEAGLEPHEFIAVGDEMIEIDDFEEAIAWYERAFTVNPESAEAWFKLGTIFANNQEIEKSLEAIENAWKINVDQYAYDYAIMLIEYGEPESAILVLNEALEQYQTSENRLDWWKTLNSYHFDNSGWDETELALVRALEEFPNNPDLHISLGWVYYNQGRGFDNANDQFLKAIDLLEEGGRGFAALAELYRKEQRFYDADVLYQKAIERAPNHRWYYLDRGDNSRESGDFSSAIEIYWDAIDRFPNFARAYFQLAWVFHLQGNNEEAISAIETSLELLNTPVESYYLRAGDIFRLSGLTSEALEAYYKVLSINPNNQAALAGIELLGDG